MSKELKTTLSILEIDRIIEMAWEDRTTFDTISLQFGLKEQEVIELMRNEMKHRYRQTFLETIA